MLAMALSIGVCAPLLGGCDSGGADRAPAAEPAPWRNHLAAEASPYLQLHAENPVDWYPWGDEALQRARAEQKLIFLSVGYSTCYWCHVMEREVFSNPEIAALMNEHFISIKVDREERPDIDEIYMTAAQMLTGSGGWPNSVFLTPEGRPFFAGTYFPARDSPGRRGFPAVLLAMHDAWVNRRETVLSVAQELAEKIERISERPRDRAAPPSPAEAAQAALRGLRRDFDAEQGGFGQRMKFPRAPVLDLLVSKLERQRDPETEQMLVRTLDAMAAGGIYDQLGGGFHRYSTERSWSIPHFEKMLYDNAQLAGIYARAFALTGRPLYRRIAEQTLAYLDREMSDPEGGFYSAQDAEVDGREGALYVWTRAEIDGVLGPASSGAFFGVYELVPLPGEPERGVLRVRSSLPELLNEARGSDLVALLARSDTARSALLQRRSTRPQPLRDEKLLAQWNGLAIRGLVEAARALDRPDYLRRAERVASFVLARLQGEDGSLRRSYVAGQAREQGVLDDYASVADGLLFLYHATGDPRWRDESARLADVLLERFADEANGGFYLTPEGSTLLVRPKPIEDNEVPSGNAQALRVLRQLEAGPGAERYAKAAAGIESAAAPLLLRAPDALPASVAARILARESAPTGSALAAGAGVAAAPTFPRSRDHLRAELARRGSGRSRLAVRVELDPGWHVNANPATHAFLVATAVEIPNRQRSAEIRYPRGRPFRPGFSSSAIDVYEGRFEIELDLDADLEPADRVALRFQACDTTRCLPPDRVELNLD